MAKILLADDDECLLRATRRLLEACGHQVTTAVDGAAELTLLQHQSFDLVISDFSMPVMTGLEVLLRLRVAKNNVKFILCSARDEPELGLICKKHGAQFLLKPVSNLEDKVNESLKT